MLGRARLSETTGVAVLRRGFCPPAAEEAIQDGVQMGIQKAKLFLAGP